MQIPFTGDLTVLEAITQSGLLTNSVKRRSITIIRGESDTVEKPQKLKVNMVDITNKGKTERNIILRPNDVVYLPPTILGRVGFAIKDILNPVQPARQLGNTAGNFQYNQMGFGGQQQGGGSGSGSSNYR